MRARATRLSAPRQVAAFFQKRLSTRGVWGALLDTLRQGRPGYAAVDVYEQEPIVNGNHPFLSMPNVLCTPHLGWAEWQNFELYFRETFEQIAALEKGQQLRLKESLSR